MCSRLSQIVCRILLRGSGPKRTAKLRESELRVSNRAHCQADDRLVECRLAERKRFGIGSRQEYFCLRRPHARTPSVQHGRVGIRSHY